MLARPVPTSLHTGYGRLSVATDPKRSSVQRDAWMQGVGAKTWPEYVAYVATQCKPGGA
jgi:hypothetical protein